MVAINQVSGEIFIVTKENRVFNVANFTKNILKKINKFSGNKGDYLGSYHEFINGQNTHPHNTHFQFLAELGLVGYVFLVFLFFYFICHMQII